MAKKKSYNPFKMWGSYVGLIIVILVGVWAKSIILSGNITFSTLISLIGGFLIGWGIHILWGR